MLNDARPQYEDLRQALESLKLSILAVSGEQAGVHTVPQEQEVTSKADNQSQAPPVRPSVGALREAVAHITQQFQQQMATVDATEMDEAIALRIQSIQTEISKQLHLLAMDTLFLKTARQPDTARQRQQQMAARIDLLLRYCEAILTLT